MSAKVVRILSIILIVVTLVAVLGVGYVRLLLPRQSFPEIKGELQVAGLETPVDIYRDQLGVPHIYAENSHDLFFAQGYVHAQDRFWQMDFWRHIGSARLSEMFGEDQLDTDRFLRTLGWARVAEKELQTLDPDTKAIVEAYAEGVNAYLAEHKGASLSMEYAILGLLTRGYEPEPWTPLNTLTWAKVMAWDLGGNMDGEIDRAILFGVMNQSQIEDLYPAYPEDKHPLIVPEFDLGESAGLPAPGTAQTLPQELLDLFASLNRQTARLDALIGPRGPEIGSNNWVISGKLTETGKPLLANDPHLGIQMPAIWYENGLHCQPLTTTCPYDVVGFSFAGAPAVIIGHNQYIAWGVTNVGPDVQDLYIEKINPSNPNQYEFEGKWVDMELVEETINVAGGDPVALTVRYTRHGPIISDTYGGLEDFSTEAGIALPANYAISLRWTALDTATVFEPFWRINLARNWQEFRTALSTYSAPGQNFVFADVNGNIGYQTPGFIPIRMQGDGTLPVPGWSGEYEWEGYIPFEQLPSSYNPESGYIVTANNAVVGSDYPYLLTTDWDYGYRAERIVELIEAAPGPISIEYIAQIQGDNKILTSEYLLPVLFKTAPQEERLKNAMALLSEWDGQMHMDSAAAALYAAFWRNLVTITFSDDLAELPGMDGSSRGFEVFRLLVGEPESAWWDDKQTLETENMNAIFSRAFVAAVDELEQLQGKNPQRWNWGDMHGANFENQTLGQSGIGVIDAFFNRGPFRTSGSSSVVNATGFSLSGGYELVSVPSLRMIIDMSNFQNSVGIHTTGQSGHAYHKHYIDMAEPWAQIEFYPLHWQREVIEQDAEGYLRLIP